MSGGFSTDTFLFNDTPRILNSTEQPIFLGTFTAPNGGGTILQLEIYFHANGFSQTSAATETNLLSPSKVTVMLEVLNGDKGSGINITGYAVQHGNFIAGDSLTAVQSDLWTYKIYMKMKANGNPVVHTTTNSSGSWTPSLTIDESFTNWGLTFTPTTAGQTGYKIPIQYKFKNGMIETPNGFNVSSSRRYKTNITDLPENYNLDMIMKMKPVIYQKKDEPGNTTIYPGLIAEDLHDLSANIFVSYNQNNVPESIDYARINVLLIKAAQQLNEKVDKLTDDLRRLVDSDDE